MFFVAFLINPEVNVVIAPHWVYQHEVQVQKFINKGLNANQIHRIFYTENSRAFEQNGEPSVNYEPDFTFDAVCFPDEGCYDGKLIKFFLNFDDAVSYAAGRRVGDTAVYNPNRLLERPIPVLRPQNIANANEISIENFVDEENGADNDENDASNEIESPMSEFVGIAAANESGDTQISASNESEDTQINVSNEIEDPLVETFGIGGANQAEPNVAISLAACSISNVNETGTQNSTVTTQPLPIVKKEAVLIVEPSAAHINALEGLIEEPEYTVYKDDSMEIIVDNKKGFALPFNVTSDELIKRENDEVSGQMPFNETPYGSRLYRMGDKNLEVPANIVATFKEWNTRNDKKDADHDKRFVHVLLLLLCIEIEKVTVDTIEPEALDFINSFIMVRAQGDEIRGEFMKMAIKGIINDAKATTT